MSTSTTKRSPGRNGQGVPFSDAAIDAFARLLIDLDSKVIEPSRAVARMGPAPKNRI